MFTSWLETNNFVQFQGPKMSNLQDRFTIRLRTDMNSNFTGIPKFNYCHLGNKLYESLKSFIKILEKVMKPNETFQKSIIFLFFKDNENQ